MVDNNEIRFYGTKQPYFCFSNFYRASFVLDGETWPTSEHYYQAQKMRNYKFQTYVRLAKTPKDAKDLGRCITVRDDWDVTSDTKTI